MSDKAMQNQIGSPVEHTLNLLQTRLCFAEGQTDKLVKQLQNYGFKRMPGEKPDIDSCDSSLPDYIPENYGMLVTRLCKMESLITSLRSGMESLEAEKSTTLNRLMQEKSQILENYGRELKQTQEELDKSKQIVAAHTDAKLLLERQVGKLKKETVKRLEAQKSLVEKLKGKEIELDAFQSKFTEVAKELSNEQSYRKKMDDLHSSLQLKIAEMEAAVESERANVNNLNHKCISLTEDALLARGEFEKEFSCRLQFQDMMAVHEEEIRTASENLQKYAEKNTSLSNEAEELKEKISLVSLKNEKLKISLDSTCLENEKVKQALKKAAIDNQALVNQGKEALSREQAKVNLVIKQQNKILDSAKNQLLTELDKQQKHSQGLESENLVLTDKINDLIAKNGEYDFKLRMSEQSKENEVNRLQNIILSAEKVKDELARQLKHKEKELVDINNSMMKEKSSMMQKYDELSNSLKQAEDCCENLEREKSEITEKLSWVNVKQLSQENIEKKFTEMVAEKNKLAYEKGLMQAKIDNLESQLHHLKLVEDEKQTLQSQFESIGNEHTQLKLTWNQVDNDLQHKTSQLQRIANECESYKMKLMYTDKDVSQLTTSLHEVVEQKDDLMKQAEEISKKHKVEVSSYLSRLDTLEKERENVSTTFKTMMSTNDNLQRELEISQENMGRKDAQMEELLKENKMSADIVNELQYKMEYLTNQVNKLDGNEKNEIIKLKEELEVETYEKCRLLDICDKQKEEVKNMKVILKKLGEESKSKESELKGYISAKHTDLSKVKKQYDDDIIAIKEEHKKEINKLKRQIQEVKRVLSEKQKDREDNKQALMGLASQLKVLEDDKETYVVKNGKQAKLLEEFMVQIAELQTELSNIIESKSESNVKLKEKEALLASEKRKRRDIEQKYQALLTSKVRKDLDAEKVTSAACLQHSQPQMTKTDKVLVEKQRNSATSKIDKLLSRERRQTQKMIEDYQRTKENSVKDLEESKENYE